VRAFVQSLLARDGGAALEAIARAASAGEDLGALCREVVEMARQMLVLQTAPTATLPELSAGEAESLRAAAAGVSADELIYLLRVFLDADAEMRRSPHPRVELEIAAVRTTRRPVPQALDALLAKVEDALARFDAGGGIAGGAAPARPTTAQEDLLPSPPVSAAPARAPRGLASGRQTEPPDAAPAGPSSAGWRSATRRAPDERALGDVERARLPERPDAVGLSDRAERPSSPRLSDRVQSTAVAGPEGPASLAVERRASAGPPTGDVAEGWERVVGEIVRKKALLGSVLQSAVPMGVEGEVLMLALAGNHFHKEMLTDRANRELINQAIQQSIAGARRFELDASGEGGIGGARNHPDVQAVLNEFQGEVVAVRPRAQEEGEPS
jgi:hypothetical protein